MRRLLVLLALLVPAPAAAATTFNTANCSEATVQAAINGASAGDEVHLPACNVTWSTAVTVNSAITLSGSGMGVTIITGAPSTQQGAFTFLTFTTPSTGVVGLRNIEFKGPSSGSGGNADSNLIHFFGNSQSIIIEHIKCTAVINTGCFGFYGYTRGVMSDWQCIMQSGQSPGICITLKPYSWGDVGWNGDKSWNMPSTIGTAQAFVFENGTCTNTSSNWLFCFDANAGARFTVRFSTFNNMFIGTHGLETSGRTRGVRQIEFYKNTFNVTGGLFFDSTMSTRGGTGIVWGNTITASSGSGVNQSFDGQTYRSKTGEDRGVYTWAQCSPKTITGITRSGTTATATTSGSHGIDDRAYIVIDSGAFAGNYTAFTVPPETSGGTVFTFATDTGKPSSAGATTMHSPFDNYPDCLDQAGGGMGDYISGDIPKFGGTGVVPIAWTNQILDPIYIFRNLKNGALSNGVTAGGTNPENRNFYNETSSFTGATGIGVGTLAARPSTCTAGTGYWATDQGEWWAAQAGADGQLYTCTGNAWTLKYTPLAYPHPLLSGAPTPTAPVVTITAPNSIGHSETTAAVVSLAGTATDDVSVSSVTCSHPTLGACTVAGIANWTVTNTAVTNAIDNVFTVTASDGGGLQGTATQHVFAKADPGTPTDDFAGDWAYGPGPQWRVIGNNAPVRSGGQLVNTGFTFDGLLWLAQASATNQQHIEAVIGTCAQGTGIVGVLGRVSGTTNSDFNAYGFQTDCKVGGGAVSTNFGIFRNGAFSSLIDFPVTFFPGDTMALELQGDIGRVYKNGVLQLSPFAMGGEITAGGYGLRMTGTASLDSWTANDLGGDVTSPSVSITNPNGGNPFATTTTPITSITWTASDANGITACTCTNSAGGTCTTNGGTTSGTIPTLALLSGLNTVTVDCTDPAGNHGNGAIQITFSTPPTLNIFRIRR